MELLQSQDMAGWIRVADHNLWLHYPRRLCRGQFIADIAALEKKTDGRRPDEGRCHFQQFWQWCQGASGDDISGESRHLVAAASVNRDRGRGHSGRFPEKRRLSLVRLDESHIGGAENCQNQARQSRPAPKVQDGARRRRQMTQELTAVEDMAAPDIRQAVGTHEIDADVPALEEGDIGLEAAQRFT